jgi:hypothetical protein
MHHPYLPPSLPSPPTLPPTLPPSLPPSLLLSLRSLFVGVSSGYRSQCQYCFRSRFSCGCDWCWCVTCPAYVCAHTCIHAYMHTCIHAYMHTCIHAYMHTYTTTAHAKIQTQVSGDEKSRLNLYVKPAEEVVSYLQPLTGLSKESLEKNGMPLEQATAPPPPYIERNRERERSGGCVGGGARTHTRRAHTLHTAHKAKLVVGFWCAGNEDTA